MSLQKKLYAGLKWSVLGTVGTSFVSIFQQVVLARHLGLAEFGSLASMLIILNFIAPFTDLGLNAALIQSKGLSSQQFSTIFWLKTLLAIFFLLALHLIDSSWFNLLFKDPLPRTYFLLIGYFLLNKTISDHFLALLQRELAFKQINQINIYSVLINFCLTCLLLIFKFDIWALFSSYFCLFLIRTAFYLYYIKKTFLPHLSFHLGSIVPFIKFGIPLTFSQVVTFIGANIDDILIGRLLGKEALGLYTFMWNLAMIPLNRINPIVSNLTFPLFSRAENTKEDIQHYYSDLFQMTMAINFLLALLLGLYAHDVLYYFFGSKWLTGSFLLTLLSIVGFLRALSNPTGSILLAKGKAQLIFGWNIFWTILIFVGTLYVITRFHTLEPVAIMHIFFGLTFGLILHAIAFNVGRINPSEIFFTFLKIIPFCLVMIFFYPFFTQGSSFLKFIAYVLLTLLAYLAYFRFFLPKTFRIFKKYLVGIINNTHN